MTTERSRISFAFILDSLLLQRIFSLGNDVVGFTIRSLPPFLMLRSLSPLNRGKLLITELHHQLSLLSSMKMLTLLYFSRTLQPSASSGYTIGRLSLTQLYTPVIGIPISLYHLGTSSSHRFPGLPLGRRHSGWITNALLWGAVGTILLTCDHHLILFLFAVCSAGCMFTRRLIPSFLILSILVFPAAFLRHLISVVVNGNATILIN